MHNLHGKRNGGGSGEPTKKYAPARPNTVGTTTMVGEQKVFRRDQPLGEEGTKYSLVKVAEKIAEGRLHPMVRAWTTKVLAEAGNPKGPRHRAKAILEALRTVEGFPKATRWVPDPTGSEYIAGAHLTLGDGKSPPLFALGDCFTEGTLMLAAGDEIVPVEQVKPGMKIWGLDRWSSVERAAFKGTLAVDVIRFDAPRIGPYGSLLQGEVVPSSLLPLTSDHHVYVLDCREHAMLTPELEEAKARPDDPYVRSCQCAHGMRIEKRIRVAELRAGMMLPAPTSIGSHSAARSVSLSMRRVQSISRAEFQRRCWDITTDDHRVYLPEHDVTVSQCDDLTVAFGSAVLAPLMYLAAAESVGAEAAVVGHAYGKEKTIVHVLGAIYDEGRWWYADPSVKDLPFGECKPFTRERVYKVPSLELLCDADICLTNRGPAAGPPPPPRRGDFVTVDGVGDDVADLEADGPSTLLGFCDLSGCCDSEDTEELARMAREIQRQRAEAASAPSDEELKRRTREAEDAMQRARRDSASAWTDTLEQATKQTGTTKRDRFFRATTTDRQATDDQRACEEECMRADSAPAAAPRGVGACCGQDEIGQIVRPGAAPIPGDPVHFPTAQETLDRQARGERLEKGVQLNASVQRARESLEVAQQAKAAAVTAWNRAKTIHERRTAEEAATRAAREEEYLLRRSEQAAKQALCKLRCAERNPYRDQPCDPSAANDREARAATAIKKARLENQSDFTAWAEAPCADNPLAWNIINVPPQGDYAAQDLFAPWHDGMEPITGASWEIPNSAPLPITPRKD